MVQSQVEGREVTALYCLTALEKSQITRLGCVICQGSKSQDWMVRNPDHLAGKTSTARVSQQCIQLFAWISVFVLCLGNVCSIKEIKSTPLITQVNKKLYESLDGTEIVFLADGYDLQISSTCFPAIKSSGAIIHTISLSSGAPKDLEEIADMTGERWIRNLVLR